MKPVSGEGTPKSSQNKTIKKSSKSRSKVTKTSASSSSGLPQTPTTPTTSHHHVGESPTTSSNNDANKDKSQHKSYAGFGPKTIKYFWEQHDTSRTDIMPDVYPHLAEDVSYKVWECVNNIKTYARHSGGRVTYDLVNEVLKDSDVPPVVGAGDTDWDRIEYDGSFFFHADSLVELRNEYLKEVEAEVSIDSSLTSDWVLERKWSKQLYDFLSHVFNGIFVGDEECFNYALDTVAFSPYIGCTVKVIFRKCVETLAFEQKAPIIERILKFLQAVTFNYHSHNVDCREQLFHLAEICICLLVDTPKLDKKEESFELVKNFLENSDAEIKKDSEALNQMDVDDIRSEYEALFQMMERDGFQERESTETNSFEDIKPTMSELQVASGAMQDDDVVMKDETKAEIKVETVLEDTETQDKVFTVLEDEDEEYSVEAVKVQFSPYRADIVDFEMVDEVCSTIGQLGAHFGYFQSECIFHIQRRLEKFFEGKEKLAPKDFEFVSRAIRGLISLGEHAFREFIPYAPLISIDSEKLPDYILNDFSMGAIFLQKMEDIFLYEWLEDICGDKLQPFMVNHYRYHQQLITKRFKQMRPATYKIKPKVYAKLYNGPRSKKQVAEGDVVNEYKYKDYFPDYVDLKPAVKKIGFRFSGCRPVIIKPKEKSKTITYVGRDLEKFCQKFVVAKRKLLKPLTDRKKCMVLSNFCFLQI